jgi:hypothetical protein
MCADLVICDRKGHKNMLSYNEYAYKKFRDDFKLEDWFLKKEYSQFYMGKIAGKKIAYNEYINRCSCYMEELN